MDSSSKAVAASRALTVLFAALALGLTAIVPSPPHVQAEVKRDAQGPWGGKTRGRGHTAEVNGVKLYYETVGTGRPLILLHGGLGALEMFGPNLAALARVRQVIAVDLQGHGRTPDVDRPISAELMADDVASLIKRLQLERPDIMGFSLGGSVALQTAIRHPELVGKLVAVSTPLRRNAFYPEILASQAQVGAAAAEALKKTPMYQLYASIAPRPEDFPRLLAKMGEAMKKDFDYSHDVARLRATTLVVAADADIFPPSHAIEFFGLLDGGKRDPGWDGAGRPKSQLAILPGLTHYTIFRAPALAAAVIPFLDEGRITTAMR